MINVTVNIFPVLKGKIVKLFENFALNFDFIYDKNENKK